jgi:hypothetical protein
MPHAPIITNALWETMVAATAQGLERNGCDPSHQPSRHTASPDPSPLKPCDAVTSFPVRRIGTAPGYTAALQGG